MSDNHPCPVCGAAMLKETPAGLCAACLLNAGLAPPLLDPAGLGGTLPLANPAPQFPFPAEEQPGDVIGRYKLVEEIGHGGFGRVYLAEQTESVRRRVALKILKLGMDTKEVVARFGAERQALAMMDHPNIAKVFDAGATATGRPYFVMEFVAGEPITLFCDKHHLSVAERIELFITVCESIQHAHQKGIIHRDIKPGNVLVADFGGRPLPKVIDFGIAKALGVQLTERTILTASGSVIGTLEYMSPEQASGGKLDIDTRADIYSLGVMLYELLTGNTPLTRESIRQSMPEDVLQRVREEEAPKPSARLALDEPNMTAVAKARRTDSAKLFQSVNGDLDWIVMKALEKDRERRYETANALAEDLRRYLGNEPVLANPPSIVYRAQKLVRRHKIFFVSSAAIMTSLAIGLAISLRLFVKEREDHRRAIVSENTAEQAANEVIKTLAASDFSEASRLIDSGNAAGAVAYLCRILQSDPGNQPALARLTALLTYRAWMAPTVNIKVDNWANSVEFSPDGRRVLIASYDQTAQVWDARTGEPIGDPMQHDGNVNSAVFSPDGALVATASFDYTARVWSTRTGRALTKPLQHQGIVFSARFSPDGKRVVTASGDHTARVWDAQTGRPLTPPLQHRDAIYFADFSFDSMRIVTASSDNTARLWNAQTGQAIGEPMHHGDWVTFAQFSPDGKRVVTVSRDNTARIWDAQTGQALTSPMKHDGFVNFAQFSPDGQWIVTASRDGTARIWDAGSGRLAVDPLRHGDEVNCARFSPDGLRILTASRDNTARIWDARTGEMLAEPMREDANIRSAEFSPDGRRVITVSQSMMARIWDPATTAAQPEMLKHDGIVNAAQFSPDGARIVTASQDNTARIWDAETAKVLTAPLAHQGFVNFAQFSADGRRVVTTSADHTARVWDALTGLPLTPPMQHRDWINCAQFSPDGKRIVTASRDNTARVWDARTGEPLTPPLAHDGEVLTAQFRFDGKRVLTTSRDTTARVWNAATGQPLTEDLRGLVTSAQFSPDGARIVTASGDGTARVWDVKTGELLFPPLKHKGAVTCAQFSPDGKRIVTTSADKSVQVWDSATGQPLFEPLRHDAEVTSAQFSPDGKRIVTAALDKTARVWDATTGQPLAGPFRHAGLVYSVQFSPDGRRIVTCSGDNAARVWDVGLAPERCPVWLLRLAEALCGERLGKESVVEPTMLNRADAIAQMRHMLQKRSDNEDGVRWARWLLAEPSTRPLSPFCKITPEQQSTKSQ